ncbi:tRNA 5-methylaminomethyl-2-thiouridine biosynthesis bifunctional protein MnmC [Ferriphaselus amnicola]|uniref:tRNA 5-methylaminomethyl-2-thiouridine biosynthesis bifunctional protein MnmC n=1 Tax=Ferriphaselus amnicola TaxID=1188319 RepID=A0A2Z6GD62_9PROT|nr:bifunctional tRNA (5-methylaminomethyl-2-thiouridine)(34)-methyltransferase MnmD/FAD-dependent 5-carboxymethylaminomethyl-2-thiouridine(34) oxidoreductase MnmC [Ferriphaselus amnicola]BBE51397.1 tRNA 5-methylaminomethyl-2-thiouridine biosynthesis bifunctional protein MnmC [Ferriphaselus amnicola]
MLDWKDGQPYSNRYGDVYFSTDSGLEESRHVFLQGNRLAERFAGLRSGEVFTVGETGFGTGLNFLCVWQLFEQTATAGATLDFFSIERFPLGDEEIRAALRLWPELASQAQVLCANWKRRVPGWNRWSFAGGRIRLTLAICDVADALPELMGESVGLGRVDAWFLDGFSPSKNPEMWSPEVFSGIANASRFGATLATYSSAGWVRRGLSEAGFTMQKSPGFGRKREMLCGKLTAVELPDGLTIPQSAIVIGGGLAGCAAAYALAQRGVAVTLVERAEQLAQGASGNPLGILHARFSAGVNPLHRFVLASYGHALSQMDAILPVDNTLRAECGLLQLAFSDAEIKRIGRLVMLDWPIPLFEAVDAEAATKLTGMRMERGGLWFPSAGWVVPPALCERWAGMSGITQQLGHAVETLTPLVSGWQVAGQNAQGQKWQINADIVVVCCGHQAKQLAQFEHFPLTPVRGQISALPGTQESIVLNSVVCADGYSSPAECGVHIAGATHSFDDEGTDVRSTDHAVNLARLEQHIPSLRSALGDLDLDQLDGRASIRCSAPGAVPLVGKVEQGLYCSLAHGTRGLLTAGISGELIAALACDTLPPLPMTIVVELSPEARLQRKKTT